MLKIKLAGSEKIIRELEVKHARLTNYRAFFEDVVVPALFARFDEIFEKEGAVGGAPRWKPLRPATLAEKRRRGYRLEILQRKGRLRRAYTGRSSDTRIDITANTLRFQNRVPYGIYHERGGRRLPKREVVGRILAYKAFHQDLRTGLAEELLARAA